MENLVKANCDIRAQSGTILVLEKRSATRCDVFYSFFVWKCATLCSNVPILCCVRSVCVYRFFTNQDNRIKLHFICFFELVDQWQANPMKCSSKTWHISENKYSATRSYFLHFAQLGNVLTRLEIRFILFIFFKIILKI